MKAMNLGDWFNVGEAKLAFWIGLICGLLKMFSVYLLTDTYGIVLVKVLITAVVGGMGGVIGKYLINYLKKQYDKKFKNKK